MSATYEHVCSCGRRDDVPSEAFELHMHAHFVARERAVRWVEIDGQPLDRKPRAGSVPVTQPKED